MAGESPDRSKRYESSTGSTPGNGLAVPGQDAAVPASRDPRVPVAREAAARDTDQATAVFSRRDLKKAEDTPAEGGDAPKGEGASKGGDAPKGEGAWKGQGGGSGSVEDRSRASVAAWVASADAKEGGGSGESGDAESSEGDAKGGADEEAGAGAADGDADGDGDGTAHAVSDAADEPEREPEPEPGPGPEAQAEAEADAEAEAKPESKPEPEPKPETDVKTDAGTGTEDADDSADGPDGAPEADAGTEPDEPTSDKPSSDKPSGKAPEDASDEPSDEPSDKAPEPPVDQPTAIFKAPRVPAVDQPTTMLKLGDKLPADKSGTDEGRKKGEPKTEPKTEPPAAERDAERTSKFVALKSLDEPRLPKSRPAPRTPPASPASSTSPAAPAPAAADATAAIPQIGPERTTQQPVPPKPPIDLLAELTNTPPPPPTPLRTLARRVKIWTPLAILLVVVFAVVQAVRPLPAPTLDLTAEDSYTFEGGKPDIPWPSSGQAALDVQGIGTFGSSGDQKPVPIASVAKVMTAYLILRDHPVKSGADGPMIKIDQRAEDESDAGDESTVNVTAGDSFSQREAVESILIASANNVARLLARWDAGSEKAFVEKMNAAAKDLGMTDTTYTDPSGLNNTTVSTAVDQVKLAKEAMKQPVFREVAAMMSYDDYKGVNHSNWNQLVGSNNVVGIKTGTTTSALGNLVFAAKKEVGGETRTIVGAVVRQPAGGPDNTILGASLYEGDKLIRAAQGALESATILKKGDVVGYVDDGLGGRTPVVATEDVKAIGWAGLTVELTFEADELPHTAKSGTKVGTLTVGDGTSSAVKVPVALRTALAEPGFTDKLTRLG